MPGVPPGRRVTGRLRKQTGTNVADRGVTPAEADRRQAHSFRSRPTRAAASGESAVDNGSFPLVVPSLDVADDIELSEHELDSVIAGLNMSWACCCPCCCTT